METITSTKGTPATTHLNKSGAMFVTAPTSNPPADRPEIASVSGEVQPLAHKYSPQSIKSLKVFILFKYFPCSSYQYLPSSPPPRMCATAIVTPLSNNGTTERSNAGSFEIPYDPYPSNNNGPCLCLLPFLYAIDTGIFVWPSLLVTWICIVS